jgi:aspartate/methionine/tyrosine aminotransferase
MGTLSKAYGLPGLRVGWCLAPPEVLARMAALRDYLTLHLSPMVELIAARVIENADTIVGMRLAQARANRERVARWIEEQEGAVSWVRPTGGVCAFPRLHQVPDVEELCHRLAREHRVLLVPGTCFEVPGHVRLGFGRSPEELEAGLQRLSEVLAASGAPVLA